MKAVISLCDRTGNMVRPWAEAGCECWCVDIQHSIRKDRTERVGAGLIHFVWGDVRSWRMPKAAIGRVIQVFAFPPCPHLTCTAARDFIKKGGWMLADAVQLFDACEVAASFSGAPYMIENPATSRLNTHRRKPDHKFHPWEYAGYLPDIETDNTMKLTGLWTGNGFVMPPPISAPPPHRQDCWMATPSDDRADTRSETPMGFAKAVFQANWNQATERRNEFAPT
jgi:hypothetical protein